MNRFRQLPRISDEFLTKFYKKSTLYFIGKVACQTISGKLPMNSRQTPDKKSDNFCRIFRGRSDPYAWIPGGHEVSPHHREHRKNISGADLRNSTPNMTGRTVVLDNGNEWRNFRVVPRSLPLHPLV